MKTLKIVILFFSVAILTHALILWAYDWNAVYTFLVLIADVVAGAITVVMYFSFDDEFKF